VQIELPPGVSSLRNQHFGWKFQSWVVYQRIALRMSYRLISKAAFDLFSEQLSPTTAQAFVEKFAGEYQHTEDLLLHNILDGPVVHLDETKINILGADQYVWVLTDNARVVFRLRPSREAAFLHPLLSSFKGSPLPISTEDTMHYLVRSRNASSI
jgi:transposase-like protein